MMLVFESFGIVASVLSFVLSLYLLWKGRYPNATTEHGRKIVILLTSLAVVSGTALAFLSYNLQVRINTKTISDVIQFHHEGTHEVHYPIPFKYPPYIKISQTGNQYFSPGPYIKTQDKFGFQVWIPGESSSIEWKAKGLIEK